MAWVDVRWDSTNKRGKVVIKPYKTDTNIFRVIKTRQKDSCNNCGCDIPPKSYAYSGGYIRLCLSCGEQFSHTGIKAFWDIIKFIKENQEKFKENKDKWEANNTLAKL